ncbi:MAG: alkaline phosphatase family protein, partial [bacterium]
MKGTLADFLKHIGHGVLAGLVFSLLLGIVFGLKMIGINETTHSYRFAYPFLLNFIPMYLILGVLFGVLAGLIGGFLLSNLRKEQSANLFLSAGLGFLIFCIVFIIFRAPLGPVIGIFLASLLVVSLYAPRTTLLQTYFTIFFAGVVFNYSWQWVRQHFIVNPLAPVAASSTIDFVFTVVWALLFLFGLRLFLKAFFRLPVKTFYFVGVGIVVIALLAGGVFYFMQSKAQASAQTTDFEIERQPIQQKVVLIGIDGMWWKVINPLLAQGKMPHFQQLMERGSYGELATLYPTFSAAIWTSISTGKSPEKHTVTSFLVWKFPWSGFTLPCFKTPRITKEMDWMRNNLIVEAPITNQFLEATPIWLMLNDYDVTVGTVNWWLSWPAHHVNGFVVTDHCLYNKSNIMQNYKQKEGETPYDIYPQELLRELAQFSHNPDDLTDEEIRRFLNVSNADFLKEFRAIDSYNYLDIAYEASMFKYSYPEDVTYASAAQ